MDQIRFENKLLEKKLRQAKEYSQQLEQERFFTSHLAEGSGFGWSHTGHRASFSSRVDGRQSDSRATADGL